MSRARAFLFFSDLGPTWARAWPRAGGASRPLPGARHAATRERIRSLAYRLCVVLDWSHAGAAVHMDGWLPPPPLALRAGRSRCCPRASRLRLLVKVFGDTALEVRRSRRFPRLVANLRLPSCRGPRSDWGRPLYALALPSPAWSTLPPWSVAVYLAGART
jgi:hypothetical protein